MTDAWWTCGPLAVRSSLCSPAPSLSCRHAFVLPVGRWHVHTLKLKPLWKLSDGRSCPATCCRGSSWFPSSGSFSFKRSALVCYTSYARYEVGAGSHVGQPPFAYEPLVASNTLSYHQLHNIA